MKEPTAERRAPRYKPTLVDPYRDHLCQRWAEDPAMPVTHLLREIKELGPCSGTASASSDHYAMLPPVTGQSRNPDSPVRGGMVIPDAADPEPGGIRAAVEQ
ncbi:hypothetical protein ABH930_002780 [Kitasatospora sp. GAS204A]|nr:hypothetical protein [Kitasatospora sp. GAS204B]